jgi:hypothetical protein
MLYNYKRADKKKYRDIHAQILVKETVPKVWYMLTEVSEEHVTAIFLVEEYIIPVAIQGYSENKMFRKELGDFFHEMWKESSNCKASNLLCSQIRTVQLLRHISFRFQIIIFFPNHFLSTPLTW